MQIVDNLLSSHKTVIVGDTQIPVRRLVTPAKRLIISNVPPPIPNEYIADILRNHDLKLVSPVSDLRAGLPTDEFTHILSFRRQVFISPPEDETTVLPSSIMITYAENNYRIFLSHDNMECFICKKPGHIANNCPNTNKTYPSLPNTQQEASDNRTTTSAISATETDTSESIPREAPILHLSEDQKTTTQAHNISQKQEGSKKRPLTPSTSTTETDSINHDIESYDPIESMLPPPLQLQHIPRKDKTKSELPKNKRQKQSKSRDRTNTDDAFSELKTIFDNNVIKCTIPYENFKTFIENCHGNSDPLTEARRFTSDVKSLLISIIELRLVLSNKSLKNRFTRLAQKIKKQLDQEGADVESIVSVSSQNSQDEDMEVPLIDIDTEQE